jgi:hypothetical protein
MHSQQMEKDNLSSFEMIKKVEIAVALLQRK